MKKNIILSILISAIVFMGCTKQKEDNNAKSKSESVSSNSSFSENDNLKDTPIKAISEALQSLKQNNAEAFFQRIHSHGTKENLERFKRELKRNMESEGEFTTALIFVFEKALKSPLKEKNKSLLFVDCSWGDVDERMDFSGMQLHKNKDGKWLVEILDEN